MTIWILLIEISLSLSDKLDSLQLCFIVVITNKSKFTFYTQIGFCILLKSNGALLDSDIFYTYKVIIISGGLYAKRIPGLADTNGMKNVNNVRMPQLAPGVFLPIVDIIICQIKYCLKAYVIMHSIQALGSFILENDFATKINAPKRISPIIYFTLPVTVTTAERSFLKLKIIKNYLRNSIGQNIKRTLYPHVLSPSYTRMTANFHSPVSKLWPF
ncbi:zinc finger MYM-type protein 1-like [Aphis craccivora]|uniref:Zinc finger MYM-type protein 1-like n=1 Tax=Aphis craccivora TaxID=307492 RepID=A0A6G0YE00_APHCR|nr:zinc finger MYM-type protein 1-like [Aphis craccivora]